MMTSNTFLAVVKITDIKVQPVVMITAMTVLPVVEMTVSAQMINLPLKTTAMLV